MKTRRPESATKGFLENSRASLQRNATGLLVVCLVGGLVTAFFLVPYMRWGFRMPFGYDAARYLDQTNLVAKYGLSGASRLQLPPPSQLLSGRAGFFITVLTLSRVFGTDTFKFAAVVPAIAAVAIALAAGAFVSYGLRRGAWELAAVALIVGTSGALVRLMEGTYTDNLIAGALLMAAFLPLLSFVTDGRGFVASVLLLAAGGFAHPQFLAVVIGILGVLALLYVPTSWKGWRSGARPLSSTPTVRLVLATAGALAIVAGLLVLLLRGHAVNRPVLPSHRASIQSLQKDIGVYRLPVTIPLALLGALSLIVRARPSRHQPPPSETPSEPGEGDRSERDLFRIRFLLLVLAIWVGLTAIVIAGLYAGRRWPAHRFMAFLFPLPILAALGLLWAHQGIRRKAVRGAAAAVVVVGMLVVTYLGYTSARQRWNEYLDVGKVRDAATAAAYLDSIHLSDTQPVVFIVTDFGPHPRLYIPLFEHMLRTVLPPKRTEHAYFYVGSPENYLMHQPTLLATDRGQFNVISRRSWQALQTTLPQHPVTLLLSSYYSPGFLQFAEEHPNWRVAQTVLVVEGPRRGTISLAPYPSAPFGPVENFFYGVGALVVLTLIGLGWGLSLLPRHIGGYRVLALAPAIGIGFVLLGGVVLDVIGLRFGGHAGVIAAPLVGGLGWIAAFTRNVPKMVALR